MSYPPDEVNWPAYTHAELFSGKVIGWILMWTVLIIYFIMYGAYAYDFGTSLMVAGAESDMIAELILSIMMAVGTVLLCIVVEGVVDNWCDKWNRRGAGR